MGGHSNSPPEDAVELLGLNLKAPQTRCGWSKPLVVSHREHRMDPLTNAAASTRRSSVTSSIRINAAVAETGSVVG